MNFVSLFAGVGGFDLAFERAGMDCVGQVEIDAKCREVLHNHWPHVPKWSDVKEVDGGWFGPVDVLCGGFPCQDYSVAGKRGGLVGDRGALWWQFHRLVAECRPRWVVGENVPGLLSSNDGRDFGAIVGSLVELGYGVVWRVLDAQYFGVAQRRRRVFIVGHSGGIPRPEILAFAEGCVGDTPPRRVPGTRPAPSLANRSRGGVGLGTDTEVDTLMAFNWQNAGNEGYAFSEDHTGPLDVSQTKAVFSSPVASILQSALRGVPSVEESDGQLVVFTQNTRDEVRDLGDIAGALNQPGTKQTTYLAFSSKDHGADAGDQAPTLRSMNYDKSHVNGGGQVAIASELSVRRLTPLECERLQGFPDNWTAGQSDTQRYRQMGNAVAVPVVEWIGRNLAKLG